MTSAMLPLVIAIGLLRPLASFSSAMLLAIFLTWFLRAYAAYRTTWKTGFGNRRTKEEDELMGELKDEDEGKAGHDHHHGATTTEPYHLSQAETEAFRLRPALRAAAQQRLRHHPLFAALSVLLIYDATTLAPLKALSHAAQAEYRRSLRLKLRLGLTLLVIGTVMNTLLASSYVHLAQAAGLDAWDATLRQCLADPSTVSRSGGTGAVPAWMQSVSGSPVLAAWAGMLIMHAATLVLFVGGMCTVDSMLILSHMAVGWTFRPMLIAPWRAWSPTEFWVSAVLRPCGM
jgi:hypothetical protein